MERENLVVIGSCLCALPNSSIRKQMLRQNQCLLLSIRKVSVLVYRVHNVAPIDSVVVDLDVVEGLADSMDGVDGVLNPL